jgi:hypothetical protein
MFQEGGGAFHMGGFAGSGISFESLSLFYFILFKKKSDFVILLINSDQVIIAV